MVSLPRPCASPSRRRKDAAVIAWARNLAAAIGRQPAPGTRGRRQAWLVPESAHDRAGQIAAAEQILASAGIAVSADVPEQPLLGPADEVLAPVPREAATNILLPAGVHS